MAIFKLNVNSSEHTIVAEPDTPLLWVLRDRIGLTGTKFGCGAGMCGACTVHLNDRPVRSCMIRIADVAARRITTIEGLSVSGDHPVQQAWIEEDVAQCGYCQPGQIMSAVALLRQYRHPTDEQINAAMRGNLCRCGTYQRIRHAILRAANEGRS